MATYLDGSWKIWLTLNGFDWNLADLVGFGRRYMWISKLDFARYSRSYLDYERIWMDLA